MFKVTKSRLHELDVAKTKSGRIVTILEVFDDGKAYLVEYADHNGEIATLQTSDIRTPLWCQYKNKQIPMTV